MTPEQIREEILKLTRAYAKAMHAKHLPAGHPQRPAYAPAKDGIPYAARVFGPEEVEAAVGSTLDFWLTLGKEGAAMEKSLADFLGVRHVLLVNSGSSANLVAFSALTSHKLPPKRRIRRGDEVITCAAGFPTTVAPIIQNGAVPVFIDNDPVTGNIDVSQLEAAFVAGKTKAVMVAHTLGNPFDIAAVLRFCRKHELWLVEDNCDALGSTYSMPKALAKELGIEGNSPGIPDDGVHTTRYTGTWGDLSTQSFYPPHHLTMGEGGAVSVVRHPPLKSIVESFRDWGRDCWCASGIDNTCGKRFGWQLGDLPEGYDHKYIYGHLGYNVKPLDIQAAIGLVQLTRLPNFIEARKVNWTRLRSALEPASRYLKFSLPTHATGWSKDGVKWDATGCSAECSWFGFMIFIKEDAPFTNSELGRHLDEKKIGNRMLFGGNLVRQPAFVRLRQDYPEAFRVVGNLAGADKIMRQALFVGTFPGLTESMIDDMAECILNFIKSKVKE
jgi:CDP-6-deoxy-D-xylo-4-hexulose-3-dehydrase